MNEIIIIMNSGKEYPMKTKAKLEDFGMIVGSRDWLQLDEGQLLQVKNISTIEKVNK